MQDLTPNFFFGIKECSVILFCVLLGYQNNVRATDDDTQQWSTINVRYKINDEYFVNLLGQGRFALNDDRAHIYVIRPSVHYNFTGSTTGGIGYDYLYNDPGNDEQRLWQEILFSSNLGERSLSNRFRLEERFIKDIPVIYRARYKLKANYPLTYNRWSLIGSNEIFFNLNSRGTGPAPGLDQNRLFTGLGYSIGQYSSFEFGYQWRYLHRRDAENINDHILIFSLFFDK